MKTVRLSNFTGTIRKNANGTVSVVGRATRGNPGKAKFNWSVIDGYGHTLQNFSSKVDAQRMAAQWRRSWANADKSLTGRLKIVRRGK